MLKEPQGSVVTCGRVTTILRLVSTYGKIETNE